MEFGKFTENSRKILAYAHNESLKHGSDTITTEHILLGIMSEKEGIAYKVISDLGVDTIKIRDSVKVSSNPESVVSVDENLFYSVNARKVIESSIFESKKFSHVKIDTEHILLGIVKVSECTACDILKSEGLTLSNVRNKVLEYLSEKSKVGSVDPHIVKDKTPVLDSLAKDLTQMAVDGKLDKVIGRRKEILRTIEILSRRTKNNPVLVGDPGVGKTALVEGLALKIVSKEVPDLLLNKRVMVLDIGNLVAGTKFRGEFEDRMKNLVEELEKAEDVILFIDELHTLIGAGGTEGSLDASNILKPALARGDLQCIGATTVDEYRKYIEKDSALERRFQPVKVGEPSVPETIQILKGLKSRYEAHHKVIIPDEIIEDIVGLSERYINDRFLPDKAIDVMDEAGSKVRLRTFEIPTDIKEIEDTLKQMKDLKTKYILDQKFELAAETRDKEYDLLVKVQDARESWKSNKGTIKSEVTLKDVGEVISNWTGVPVQKLVSEETDKLLLMEEVLKKRVIGQDEAIKKISLSIKRSRVGLSDPNRPTGSFMFLGPTGVGKTELVKVLSDTLFDSTDSMIRLDMSEYMEKHSVSRLVGSPPGYVGYEDGGQLTEKVRRNPYSIILLDEIEKAHPDVFNILLQILEDGRLTDSTGRVVNFRNTIIIMTSNVGANLVREKKYVGFNTSDEEGKKTDISSIMLNEMKRVFKPEFINRLDETIVFNSLGEKELKNIVEIMLSNLEVRMKTLGYDVEFTNLVKDQIVKDGSDSNYGARPLRRAIQKLIEDELTGSILEGKIVPEKRVVVDYKKEKYIIKSLVKKKVKK